jgi:hypothetical protein
MPSRNPAQRLRDIIDNIDAIQSFTAHLDFPAFRTDRKTVYAVVRAPAEPYPNALAAAPGNGCRNSGIERHGTIATAESSRFPWSATVAYYASRSADK